MKSGPTDPTIRHDFKGLVMAAPPESTDLMSWCDSIKGSITATTSVPELTVHMMQSDTTKPITFESFIQIAVDGTPLFLGIVDDPTASSDKKKGYAKEIKSPSVS